MTLKCAKMPQLFYFTGPLLMQPNKPIQYAIDTFRASAMNPSRVSSISQLLLICGHAVNEGESEVVQAPDSK